MSLRPHDTRHDPRVRSVARGSDRCPLLEKIIEWPDAAMTRGKVLKHDGTTTVILLHDGARSWVIKRYNTKNRWHAVRRLFRPSRALNCWEAARWLQDAGIETPRPVAALEERRCRILRGRSYFVCEYVDGETLDGVLRRGDGGSDRARETLIEQASTIVRRLRDHGIVHGDLKATNFIVSGGRVLLADLDATQRASGRRLAAGLGKDLRRFLRNWEDDGELSRAFENHLSM